MESQNNIQVPGLILLHGAGLGSWIWKNVTPLLDCPVLAVDFPNRNNGSKANRSLSLVDYTTSIIKQIEEWHPPKKIIVIVHSLSGPVGLKVAKHFKDKLVGFVAISAAIPLDGGSFLSCMPMPKRLMLNLIMRLAGTTPPKSAIIAGLCNDLTPQQTEDVVNSFSPESTALYFEKCHAPIPSCRKLYLRLTLDNEYDSALQNIMSKNLDAHEIRVISSGHLPMISKPSELAKELNDFVVRVSTNVSF